MSLINQTINVINDTAAAGKTAQAPKRPQPDIRAIARLVPPEGNLVQGQSELSLHPDLAAAVNDVIASGLNHYSFFEGVDELRRAVAEKVRLHNGVQIDADRRPLELIITPGATGSLVAIAQTFLRGGSALLFEPYYPYHKRIVTELEGAVDVLKLHGEGLDLDVDELRRVCRQASARATMPLKGIIISSPANPTGRVFDRKELQAVVDCAAEFNLLLISDEVYEHFTVSASDHISPASLPGAFERTITVNSFSKCWAISGWRLGFAYGPGDLIGKLTRAGNVLYVCTPTPLQHALARVLLKDPDYYSRLKTSFGRKREIFANALSQTGFVPYESRSSFYIWTKIPDRFADASELNDLLIREAGLAGVPGSAFMDDPERDDYMRFCIAREDKMLEAAAGRLVAAFR